MTRYMGPEDTFSRLLFTISKILGDNSAVRVTSLHILPINK